MRERFSSEWFWLEVFPRLVNLILGCAFGFLAAWNFERGWYYWAVIAFGSALSFWNEKGPK